MSIGGIRRGILWAAAVLLLLSGAFLGGMLYQNRSTGEPEPVITAELIAQEITGIAEYASLEYRYTNVGKREEQVDFYGWKVPFTTKSFILTYDGAMKLGIHGGDIRVELVDTTIRLHIPQASVLSHVIHEDTLGVLDQTRNIFNQIEIADYTAFAADQKREMEQKAMDSGLLDQARENAGRQLADFLLILPGIRGVYTVEVVAL